MTTPQLFAVTQPTNLDPSSNLPMSPEETIVYMARASMPEQRTEDALKLLTYLVQHGHWSPFDMVDMVVEIHTSQAVMAQILRHWSFRFQEFSHRYATVTKNNSWPHVETRFKNPDGNRQSTLEDPDNTPMGLTHDAQQSCANSERSYWRLIAADISPESARMVLPLATLTHAYMKGSVRSWMTYFWQRLDSHTQKEHRVLAVQLFGIFRDQFPIIAQLVATNRPAVQSCTPDWLPCISDK